MRHFIIAVIAVVSCTQEQGTFTQQANTPADPMSKSLAKTRTLSPTDIKVGPGYSTPVISAAQKFIIPVPALGKRGEPLLHPANTPKAGQPILDYKGNPIGERGIIFLNQKDQSWQAAAGDGESVIIINEVTQPQAAKLYQKINDLAASPDKLSLIQLKQALAYAQQELGLNDMYNSTRSFIREKMTTVDSTAVSQSKADPSYGLKKRDDKDLNEAVYIPGTFQFKGPAASAQKFTNGGVIIEQGGTMRGIQPEIFMRTYTLADGRSIQSLERDIKSQLK